MSLKPAIALQELTAGSVREVFIDNRSFAVCNVGGEFFAVSGECPHQNGPLGHGSLHGYHLVCPWHSWTFDVRTGHSEFEDCPIATYPVSIVNQTVLIDTD